MIKKICTILFIFIKCCTSFGQKPQLDVSLIIDSLKNNANSVIRLNQVDIDIKNQRTMTIKTHRIITIFNKNGINDIDAIAHYDKKTAIKNLSATIYNAVGQEIVKFKLKDFRDQCVIDGATIFSDSRIMFLDYTPTTYPFTVEYDSEVATSNTAFIARFEPIQSFYSSIQKSTINITFPEKLGFKFKEYNFENYQIKKTNQSATNISYLANNIVAQKFEDLSISPSKVYPSVHFGLQQFNLEGVDGEAKNWREFGQWYYDKMLSNTQELPQETKFLIKNLVGNETDLLKKPKIVYQFVQDKTRYISIQVGIGGFKLMLAKDVDRLGYADCKALTNYTKALLDVVNVPSYHTIVFGSNAIKDINQEIVSFQGNHMILCIPINDNYVFLECTSQVIPFGFQGNFTDNREVLIIKPNDSQIIRTSVYENKMNAQISTGKFNVSENGRFYGFVSINSTGTQYANKMHYESAAAEVKEAHYKQYWHNINNIEINKLDFWNDKEKVIFTENITFAADKYVDIGGKNLIFNVNAFNQFTIDGKKNKNRITPFEIARGFFDTDNFEIELPEGYKIESLPTNVILNSNFGEYATEIVKISERKLIYKRSLFIKKGIYKNTDYQAYKTYLEQISRNDNAKIVLIKI